MESEDEEELPAVEGIFNVSQASIDILNVSMDELTLGEFPSFILTFSAQQGDSMIL